jgi:hypothetical protein
VAAATRPLCQPKGSIGPRPTLYHTAKAEGKQAMINSAFGTVLVLVGAPIYFFYRRKAPRAA